jgi:hypothetical protein
VNVRKYNSLEGPENGKKKKLNKGLLTECVKTETEIDEES